MDDWKISRDLKIVESVLMLIANYNGLNFEVTKKNYLRPEIKSSVAFPLGHAHGLYAYYLKIKQTLQTALLIGTVMREELPAGAPKYLEELVSSR